MTDRPYWTADNPDGYSPEGLKHLQKEDLIEVMKAWFFQNYEDPAEKTPYESAEGGYQYIWGGPYDAAEELAAEFGDHVAEDIIDEAVADIESGGLVDWAPRNIGGLDDGIVDADNGSWPPIIVTQIAPASDEPSAKQEVIDRVGALEEAVTTLGDQLAMMGHNQPPEPLGDFPLAQTDISALQSLISDVRKETESETPNTDQLQASASGLQGFASSLGHWIKLRFDKGADAFAITLAAGLAANITGLYDKLVVSWQAISNWIEILLQHL